MHSFREMPVGPHAGNPIETVIIKYPDFINWLAAQQRLPGFDWLYLYIDTCIDRFDGKPFINACCAGKIKGEPCNSPVTRLSLYKNSCMPAFWCDECDPYQMGASSGALGIVSTYREALRYIMLSAGTREAQRAIISFMAEAKGLVGTKTQKAILRFFYGG